MFDSFQNKVSKESIHSFSIAYLRQEHLKLCEMVELANAVFSPLLFVIILLDFPLICINTYQILKLSSEAGTITILGYVYWGFLISTLLVVIFIFGNRVNQKVSLCKPLKNLIFHWPGAIIGEGDRKRDPRTPMVRDNYFRGFSRQCCRSCVIRVIIVASNSAGKVSVLKVGIFTRKSAVLCVTSLSC